MRLAQVIHWDVPSSNDAAMGVGIQERRQISINVEPELLQLGIQYGLTYNIAPSKHRAIIILECIPFESVKL